MHVKSRGWLVCLRRTLSWGLLVVAVFCSGCGGHGETPAAGKDKEHAAATLPEVVVSTVTRKDVFLFREFTAQTEASDTVDVRPQVTGTLLTYGFHEGTPVRQGQVLFQVDPREYQAKVAQARGQLARAHADLQQARTQVDLKTAEASLTAARAQLMKAQQDVDRYKPLAAREVIPQQQYDYAVAQRDVARAQADSARAQVQNTLINTQAQIKVALASVQSAQAALAQAELNLGYCTVASPINGIIGRLSAYPGSLVGPTGSLVTISRSDPMYVNFSISEADYLAVVKAPRHDGHDDFELYLVDGKKYPESGRFMMVDRTLNAQTGTLLLRTTFPNPRGILRPGQFARIRVGSERIAGAILVPQSAVIEVQSLQTVLVVGPDNKISSKTIEVAEQSYQQNYIVTKGLKGGERLVVEGIQKVRAGQTCKPISSGPSPQPAAGSAAR